MCFLPDLFPIFLVLTRLYVKELYSYCGGLLTLKTSDNPLGFKIVMSKESLTSVDIF